MKALGRAVETDLGELIGIAWTRRRYLLGTALLAALAALLLSFLVSPRYHSVASVLPTKGFLKEQNIVFGRGEFTDAVQLRPTTASNGQNLVTAASFKVRESIVEQLELVEFFGHEELAATEPVRAVQLAMEDLRKATHFELSIYRDVLFIHVSTRDPDMSARVANLYIERIEDENLAHYRVQAAKLESYLENQLGDLRDRILILADSLVAHYGASGLVDIDRERDQLFSLLRTLQHQRSALDLSIARESLDRADNDPHLLRMAEHLKLYDDLLAEYVPGGNPSIGRGVGILLDPNTSLAAADLERRLAIMYKREGRLRGELAVAVMEGAREEAILPIMDLGFPASEPFWPRRWLMMLGAMVIATSTLYHVLVCDRSARRSGPAGHELDRGQARDHRFRLNHHPFRPPKTKLFKPGCFSRLQRAHFDTGERQRYSVVYGNSWQQ